MITEHRMARRRGDLFSPLQLKWIQKERMWGTKQPAHGDQVGRKGRPRPRPPHIQEALEFITIGPGVTAYGIVRSASTSTLAQVETRVNNLISNHDFNHRLSTKNGNLNSNMAHYTRAATEVEHKMTFPSWKACGCIRKPWYAWSILPSLTIDMEGYDTALINSFSALPEFRKSYGQPASDRAGYEISTSRQSALTNGAVAGPICRLLFAGQLTERVGYKKTMVLALGSMSLFIFLSCFAVNVKLLMASQCLCGLSFHGASFRHSARRMQQRLCQLYCVLLRPAASICAGSLDKLVSVGVLRGLVHSMSKWSYRIPFGVQWA